MTASAPRANATPRPYSPWRAAGSTCCGRCCVTSAATSRPRPSPRPPDMPRHLTTSLRVVGEQGPLVGGADLPVPPDRGGQGQQPLGDPDVDAGQGSSPVAFQPALVLEGVEGALDPLAPATQRAQPM